MPPSPSLQQLRAALVFVVVLIGCIQMLAVASSLLSVHSTYANSLAIVVTASGLAFIASRRAQKGRFKGSVAALPPLFLPRSYLTFLIVIVSVLAMFVVTACLTPDPSYDGHAYHIPPINQWIVKGYIHEVDPGFAASELMNGYPKGAEAVTFVFIQVFGSNMLTMLNLFFAPLGLLGIALLCHLFGATLRDSLLFGACYLLVPAVAFQYITTYVDTALGFSVVALLALLASRLAMNREDWLAEALVVGCATGTVISVKGSGILIAVVSLAGYLVADVVSTGVSDGVRRRVRTLFAWIGCTVVVSVLVGGFWYIRNYTAHGSPLYPIGVSIAGHTLWPGQPVAQVIDAAAQTPPEIRTLHPVTQVVASWLANLDVRQWNNDSVDRRLGGLGIAWTLGCVPAILVCICFPIRRAIGPQPVISAFYFLAFAVALSFLGTPMNWWARYTVWLFALGLPSMWLVLAASRHSRLLRLSRVLVMACVGALVTQGAIAGMMRLRLAFSTMAKVSTARGRLPTLSLRTAASPLPWFPEMTSPLLTRILRTSGSIAIGPDIQGRNSLIYGALSMPIGMPNCRHNLIPLAAGLTESDVRNVIVDGNTRYILWLAASPIPATLLPHVSIRGTDGPFTYLEVRTPPSHYSNAR
jgi:hypothetical protein